LKIKLKDHLIQEDPVENGEGALDKEATSHDDLFDYFRLSLVFWR
jgi:hypothetical protein